MEDQGDRCISQEVMETKAELKKKKKRTVNILLSLIKQLSMNTSVAHEGYLREESKQTVFNNKCGGIWSNFQH